MSAGSALVYAVVSTVGCIVVAIVVQRVNKRVHSDLLDAERNQWMGDSVLSVAVLLGFSAALLIEGTSLAWLMISLLSAFKKAPRSSSTCSQSVAMKKPFINF